MALTKADMAEQLFEELGLNKREAKEVVESFFEEIRSALENGEQVKLSGFGNFDLREKKQRPGRNPKTGRRDPDHGPPRRDLPPRSEAEVAGRSLCRTDQ
jgi:integration host factor subunit alpha